MSEALYVQSSKYFRFKRRIFPARINAVIRPRTARPTAIFWRLVLYGNCRTTRFKTLMPCCGPDASALKICGSAAVYANASCAAWSWRAENSSWGSMMKLTA